MSVSNRREPAITIISDDDTRRPTLESRFGPGAAAGYRADSSGQSLRILRARATAAVASRLVRYS